MSIVNTALLSYGMSGRVFHAPFIDQHPGFALLSCWERSTKRIKKHYASVRSYDTLDDLLADDAIDLVVVNTPTYTHYDFTKKVLQSGKHVIVEKAFAGNTDEARELLDLAKDVGRTLSVFQNRRWDKWRKRPSKWVPGQPISVIGESSGWISSFMKGHLMHSS